MTALAVIFCIILALAVIGFTIAELLVIADDRRSHRAYDFISEREAANRNEAARLVDEGEGLS
jgi:hypothetical protein